MLRDKVEDKLTQTLFQTCASGVHHVVQLLHCSCSQAGAEPSSRPNLETQYSPKAGMMEKMSLTNRQEKISISAGICITETIMSVMKGKYELKLKCRGIQRKSSNVTFRIKY